MQIIFSRSLAGLIFLFAGSLPAAAQSALPYVIASSGGNGVAPDGSTVNFTLGESLVTTIGSNPQFTQGFQQPNTSGNPLPVQWLRFEGKAGNGFNLLSWSTAGEKNNDRFHIERSRDGMLFEAIGLVRSKAPNGTSNSELAYTFTDKTMPAGTNYYRLQQVDKDSRFSYSWVISLDNAGAIQDFTLSPNPAKDKVYLSITASDIASVQLTDVMGKVIRTIKLKGQTTEIDLSGMASGTYYIRFTDGQTQRSAKVVKE